MNKLTDDALIEELQRRFLENKKALHDLRVVTKKLEEVNKKLRESESLKGNFLSNIKNEINNPLFAIMGLSENLMTLRETKTAPIHAFAATIHSEASNLDFQLKNIFCAAELEAGESTPTISNAVIIKIIDTLIESLRPLADEKQLSINFSNELTDEYFFKTDTEKLHIILLNLLRNAIEFSYQNNCLEIKAWLNGQDLKVSVQDFGVGIKNSDIKTIFNRFTQLDTGTTKSHGGHGLGLSVTKALLDLLDGTISVSSEDGKGSIFTISIPEAKVEVETFSSESNALFFEDAELF